MIGPGQLLHHLIVYQADVAPPIELRVVGKGKDRLDLGVGSLGLGQEVRAFDQSEVALPSLPGAMEPDRLHHRPVAERADRLHRVRFSRLATPLPEPRRRQGR